MRNQQFGRNVNHTLTDRITILKQAKHKHKHSTDTLASTLGVSRDAVTAWELGRSPIPDWALKILSKSLKP